MARIVFFCIPAHGHTNPTLGVVRELTARGHEVVYYSYEPFREKIEAAGARFVPCDAFDAELHLTREEAAQLGSDLALSTRVLVDTTLALDDMVCREMQRLQPDCIVADSMAVWGKAVAKKLGICFLYHDLCLQPALCQADEAECEGTAFYVSFHAQDQETYQAAAGKGISGEKRAGHHSE